MNVVETNFVCVCVCVCVDECEVQLCHLHQFNRVQLITYSLSLLLYRFVVEFATVFVVDIISGAFFKEQGRLQRGWLASLTQLAQVGVDINSCSLPANEGDRERRFKGFSKERRFN